MLPTARDSLKWVGNLARRYQGGKTAATLTEIERCLLHWGRTDTRSPGHRSQNLPGLLHRKPLAPPRPPSSGSKRSSGRIAAAMGTATGAGYFQTGNLPWFIVIIFSFSYYTVTPASRRPSRAAGLSLGNRLDRLSLRGRGREAILSLSI